MAKARLTMNATVKKRLRNPQQQRVQRGASGWPEAAWTAAVRLSRGSGVCSRAAALLQTLTLAGSAVMVQGWPSG